MKHQLVFYGGCTGLDKSQLLREALDQFDTSSFELIKISDLFVDAKKKDTGNDNAKIVWHKEQWKLYDKRVLTEIKTKISNIGAKLVIINKHFATISPYGYLPGLDLDSLDVLLLQQMDFWIKEAPHAKTAETGNRFGLLLVDTDSEAMRARYEEKMNNVSHYISTDYMHKDLEENRKWAGIYCSRALAFLGKERVLNDTVYVHKPDERNVAIAEIETFFSKFGLKRRV